MASRVCDRCRPFGKWCIAIDNHGKVQPKLTMFESQLCHLLTVTLTSYIIFLGLCFPHLRSGGYYRPCLIGLFVARTRAINVDEALEAGAFCKQDPRRQLLDKRWQEEDQW